MSYFSIRRAPSKEDNVATNIYFKLSKQQAQDNSLIFNEKNQKEINRQLTFREYLLTYCSFPDYLLYTE